MQFKVPRLTDFSYSRKELRSLFAEFIGTFLFVMVLAFLAVQREVQSLQSAGTELQPFLYFATIFSPMLIGLAFMFLVYVFRSYTVAHFNPAVTLAVFIRGDMNFRMFVGNWIVQILAGFASFVIVGLIFAGDGFSFAQFSTTFATVEAMGFSLVTVAALEVIGSIFLILPVVLATRHRIEYNITPFVIGAGLTIGVFLSRDITTGVLNPAVALPLGFPILFIFAPMLAGVIVAMGSLLLDGFNVKGGK